MRLDEIGPDGRWHASAIAVARMPAPWGWSSRLLTRTSERFSQSCFPVARSSHPTQRLSLFYFFLLLAELTR